MDDREREAKLPPLPDQSKCGVCGSPNVYFEWGMDINICSNCGAHETAKGWQQRKIEGVTNFE